MDQTTHTAQPKTLSWQAPEYPEYQRHPLWFLGFGLAIALVILYGVFSHSWTMVVAFVLFGIVGGIYAARKPRAIAVRLTPAGVEIDGQAYTYQVIKKFWILYMPPELKALYLETTAYINHSLRVELGDQDPVIAREYLSRFLEEDLERHETLSDAIARRLRF